MLRVRTKLAASPISGIGLFAAEPIKCGTLIWKLDAEFDREYDMRTLSPEDDLLRETLLHYGYQPGDDPIVVLCGDDARFMNHSPDANTDDVGDLTIARTDIAAGEEITCDYTKFDRGFQRSLAQSIEGRTAGTRSKEAA